MDAEALIPAKDLFKAKIKAADEAEDDIPAQDEEEKAPKTEQKDESMYRKANWTLICSLLIVCEVHQEG